MTAISVILPVYNVEQYIADCIESLKRQEFRDLEFIFVDDCSTDGSMAFVERFAREDPRVRILRNPKNMGSGPSRNRGIEAARGDYLSFVDPDDTIVPDFYELLYEKAASGDFDIIKGTRIKTDPVSGKFSSEKVSRRLRICLKEGTPTFLKFTGEHQTAIYKKHLFEDKTLRYGNSLNGQDTTFLLILCKKTQNIAFADRAIYCYRVRSGGQTSFFTEQRCWNELESLREKVDFLVFSGKDPFNVRYLEDITDPMIFNICYGISEGLIPKERETDFIRSLREQLLRIPEWTGSEKKKCELSILTDYQCLIPMSNGKKDKFFYDRVRRWAVFLSARADLTDRDILTGFDFALLSVLLTFMVNSPKSFFFTGEHFVFIREQITRLSPGQRKQMIICFPKALKKLLFFVMDRARSG